MAPSQSSIKTISLPKNESLGLEIIYLTLKKLTSLVVEIHPFLPRMMLVISQKCRFERLENSSEESP
jgi:hypothetical protein